MRAVLYGSEAASARVRRLVSLALPPDFWIAAVERNMAIPEVLDEADSEGEVYRAVQGGGSLFDRYEASAGLMA